MLSLVFKLVLVIGLIFYSSDFAASRQIGSPRYVTLAGLPNLCLHRNAASCRGFTLEQAKLVCGYKVDNTPITVYAVYTNITSRTCVNDMCHVRVGTNVKSIYGSVDCSGVTYVKCTCTNFQV
ncbi:hypothetical protein WDU94_006445 [Cyamophila willieti]